MASSIRGVLSFITGGVNDLRLTKHTRLVFEQTQPPTLLHPPREEKWPPLGNIKKASVLNLVI